MIQFGILLIVYGIVGEFVGRAKADVFPGPQDGLPAEAMWCLFWPLMWWIERNPGNG